MRWFDQRSVTSRFLISVRLEVVFFNGNLGVWGAKVLSVNVLYARGGYSNAC